MTVLKKLFQTMIIHAMNTVIYFYVLFTFNYWRNLQISRWNWQGLMDLMDH